MILSFDWQKAKKLSIVCHYDVLDVSLVIHKHYYVLTWSNFCKKFNLFRIHNGSNLSKLYFPRVLKILNLLRVEMCFVLNYQCLSS